jgi:FG-GAP-like repeat
LTFVLASLLASPAVAAPILGNYPDTSVPLSTDTTVSPSAAPTNTSRITVSTTTDFQGTFAAETQTGVVRVTNAHPAGLYPVTVVAFDSAGATATKTFTLTVTTPVTCLPVNFAKATNYATASVPMSIAVGDFNSDGKQDLAVADAGSDVVALLFGDGAGKFSRYPRLLLAGGDAAALAAGDFNGDGIQDLAVANRNSGTVSILLGKGRGTFKLPTTYGTFTEASSPRPLLLTSSQ